MILVPVCSTCRWAEWQRTPTGRISAKHCGRCSVEVKIPPLPLSVDAKHIETIVSHRFGIWPGKTITGAVCPVWERKP